jgi:hypothetical protein
MKDTPNDNPPGVAVQYHAHIQFDIMKRSMFIPDVLLDEQTNKGEFIQTKVDALMALLLMQDVAPRVTVVEVHGQTAKEGENLIPGRYIELRVAVGMMPVVLGANDQPLGNVAADDTAVIN